MPNNITNIIILVLHFALVLSNTFNTTNFIESRLDNLFYKPVENKVTGFAILIQIYDLTITSFSLYFC